MNTEERTLPPAGGEPDGWYVRRAQALLDARAELFATLPAMSLRLVTAGNEPRGRRPTKGQPGSRQLSLPIAHQRGRRQARMLR